jgi:cell division protease FtsH
MKFLFLLPIVLAFRPDISKKYPLSQKYYNQYLERTNMKRTEPKNTSNVHDLFNLIRKIQEENDIEEDSFEIYIPMEPEYPEYPEYSQNAKKEEYFKKIQERFQNPSRPETIRSENFEITTKHSLTFENIGGYDNIKKELRQCLDILTNYTKYQAFNVRTPRGIIFEGPPGTGKTMIAKGFAGEANMSFIAVSGSEFQEKYVGVGSSRIRELFKLASENIPCIIFIDEIDALGRKRSSDGETASNERDSTLNELLVSLDGFKPNSGVFVIGATNRVDLLDSALLRPGRIDKQIFIGLPDSKTRKCILEIHAQGKPNNILLDDLVDLTNGLSGAQIENLLNEAMLCALRNNREYFIQQDIEEVYNKIIAGWQPVDHQFTTDMIERISVHEMGHAIVGLLCKHHSKMTKVVINLSSPKSPGYTVFEGNMDAIYTREALFEHLMILLAGRIAEELVYNLSITTGAINDFEEALKLASRMVNHYGMGGNVIYPQSSEKYKETVDNDIYAIINEAYRYSLAILQTHKEAILYFSKILCEDRIIQAETIKNHLII